MSDSNSMFKMRMKKVEHKIRTNFNSKQKELLFCIFRSFVCFYLFHVGLELYFFYLIILVISSVISCETCTHEVITITNGPTSCYWTEYTETCGNHGSQFMIIQSNII